MAYEALTKAAEKFILARHRCLLDVLRPLLQSARGSRICA